MRMTWFLLTMPLVVAAAQAGVNLEWRLESEAVPVGEIVRAGLYAVAVEDEQGGSGVESEFFCAMQVIVVWDPAFLLLLGIDDNGPYDWASSGFPDDSGLDGLNDSFDDGNAYYHAWAQFFDPAEATPEGLLVTTFEFEALAATGATEINIPESAGDYSVTAVLDAEIPGRNIVAELGSATVQVTKGSWALGDLNCDGHVDGFDIDPFILAVLSTPPEHAQYYAEHPDCDVMLADIDGSGHVDGFDIDPFVELFTGP